jgi:hypothetical protein
MLSKISAHNFMDTLYDVHLISVQNQKEIGRAHV